MKEKRLKGEDGFHSYYQGVLGERAEELLKVLKIEQTLTPARLNRHCDLGSQRLVEKQGILSSVDGVFTLPEELDPKGCDSNGLRLFYFMDPASVLAARALPLAGAARVLDMCAAPGGKALLLSEALESTAELFCSDRSPMRRKRLIQVVRDYVPREVRERVFVKAWDGRRVGIQQREEYDAVLLDAPCSSEAHVLADMKALSEWSELRVKRLAKEQYALVTSALGALRTGGHLLYSTCALAPLENDGVIEHLLKKARHPVEVIESPLVMGERTKFGIQIWPDKSGHGPIFYCLLQKR